MKKKLLTFIISLAIAIQASAQERTVENRPYTDLRPFHFGVLVGTHFQDIEFQNAGPVTYLDADGIEQQSCVSHLSWSTVTQLCCSMPSASR